MVRGIPEDANVIVFDEDFCNSPLYLGGSLYNDSLLFLGTGKEYYKWGGVAGDRQLMIRVRKFGILPVELYLNALTDVPIVMIEDNLIT